MYREGASHEVRGGHQPAGPACPATLLCYCSTLCKHAISCRRALPSTYLLMLTPTSAGSEAVPCYASKQCKRALPHCPPAPGHPPPHAPLCTQSEVKAQAPHKEMRSNCCSCFLCLVDPSRGNCKGLGHTTPHCTTSALDRGWGHPWSARRAVSGWPPQRPPGFGRPTSTA
jgi:hypothetical protein